VSRPHLRRPELESLDRRPLEKFKQFEELRARSQRSAFTSKESFRRIGIDRQRPITSYSYCSPAGPPSSSRGTVGLVLCADWALR
jgi:hypothetical protein